MGVYAGNNDFKPTKFLQFRNVDSSGDNVPTIFRIAGDKIAGSDFETAEGWPEG